MREINSQRRGSGSVFRARSLLLSATASSLILAMALPASAQTKGIEEVIVTARKREETLLNVPVIATVITGEQLSRLNTAQDIAAIVPSLEIGEAVLSSGVRAFMRGIGTTSGDPGVDQSISLNVDGLQLTNGLAFRSSLFDLGRIEVLKGPQGLFYGKNSPGGVISFYSADPTNKFELLAGAGYEFEARAKQGDVVVSGPVTDSLKARLAARYTSSDGFFKNVATLLAGTGGIAPTSDRVGNTDSWVVRGTALWDPSSNFDARLKVNFTHDNELWAGQEQLVSCPDGTGAPPGRLSYLDSDDCVLDRNIRLVGMDPAFFPAVPALGVAPLPNGGIPTRNSTQWFGTLEMNYRPMEDLTVTSITGLYRLRTDSYLNTGNTMFAASPAVSQQSFRRRDVTEELRVNSDFSGPLNATVGAFVQDAFLRNLSTQRGNILQGFPAIRAMGSHYVRISTYSLFGQLRWQIVDRLELSGGLRWSNETRKDKPISLVLATQLFAPITLAAPRIHSDNTKPEFTVTYRPTDTLTLFGSYKTGYKSGSLNISTGSANGQNTAYGNENVKGGEIGLKSRLLDRQLAINIAGYDYHYTGLQVTVLLPAATPGLTATARTLNAGKARTYGIDFDAAYKPASVEGLGLHAAVNWNHARFQEFDNVQCWGGQMVSEGCNEIFVNATGLYTAQNLSGIPLIDAPTWSGSIGFDYEMPVGNGMTLAFSNNNKFSSRYLTTLGRRADFYQKGYVKMDLGVTLKGDRDRWEVSLSGKNLNNALRGSNCANANLQGGLLFGGTITGGTTRGPAGVDEEICYVDPGRELWLTVKFRPFS